MPCRRTSSWCVPPGKFVRSSSLLGRIGSWGYSRPLCLPVHLSGKTNGFLKGASPSVAGVLHSADWRYAMDALWLWLVDIGDIRPPPPLPWATWPEGLGPVCHNTLVKFVNVQVNIVASSTGRTRREPRLSGYATLAPLRPHDYESCL